MKEYGEYLDPWFCTKCGSKTTNKFYLKGYAKTRGFALYWIESICPNKHHWWDGHLMEMRKSHYKDVVGIFLDNGTFWANS